MSDEKNLLPDTDKEIPLVSDYDLGKIRYSNIYAANTSIRRDETNEFTFKGGTKEILRLQADGDIFLNGNLIENDKEVVDGLRQFLAGIYKVADRKQLVKIFEELLENYESAESTVIHDRSISMGDDYEELEAEIKKYRQRFLEALGDFE